MKQRIITAMILIIALLVFLFFTPEAVFFGLTVLITLLAAWEWSRLSLLSHKKKRFLYVGIILLLLALSTFLPVYNLMVLSTVWWLVAVGLMVTFVFKQRQYTSVWTRIIGVLVLVPFWVGLNALRYSPDGAWLLLFFIVIIAALDSGAYFAGTFLGKTKLAVQISPKKTVEGLLGGIILALLVAYVYLTLVNLPLLNHVGIVLLMVVLLSFFGLVGDLFESMLKRMANIKDSGTILPGHGGILDRIDSYTAAIPPFVCFLFLIGYLR